MGVFPGDSRRRVWALCGVVILTLVAIWPEHRDRSFWLDEAWVIEFARAPTVEGVWLATLEHNQPGPAGFMALVHAAGILEPWGAWVYRVPSVVSSVLLLGCVMGLVGRVTGFPFLGFLAAMTLLTSGLVQRYMFETKPYGLDAAVTVGLISACGSIVRDPTNGRLWAFYFLLAMVAVSCTFGGMFAVVGTGGVLALRLVRLEWARVSWLVFVGGLVVSALAVVIYFGYTRHLTRAPVLFDYWARAFLPMDRSFFRELGGVVLTFSSDLWGRYPSLPPLLPAVGGIAGLLVWWRRDRPTCVATLLTLGVTVAASIAGQWPMATRMNLAAVVSLHCAAFVCLGGGLSAMMRMPFMERLFRRPTLLVPLQMAFAVLLGAFALYEARGSDNEVSAVKSLISRVAEIDASDDVVVLDGAAFVNAQVWHYPISGERVRGPWFYTQVAEVEHILDQHRRAQRIWLTVAHAHDGSGVMGEAIVRLAGKGTLQLVWKGKNVGLYQFTRTGEPRAGMPAKSLAPA